MMRLSCTLAFLLLTTLVYCQKTTLLQNKNPRAKELKHKLNKTGDSLILESKRTIYRVEIFNREYGKALNVKDSKVKIALDDIPMGRFVVEATLIDKLILITLLRDGSFSSEPSIPVPSEKVAHVKKEKVSPLSRVFSKKEKNESKISTTKITSINKKAVVSPEKIATSKTNIENSTKKITKSYWLVYETRNRHSSQRIMRMADEALVTKMITRNNLDLRTVAGKSNILTVWEVYDVTKFMRYKRINRNKLIKESDCFNIVPIFKTKENKLVSR